MDVTLYPLFFFVCIFLHFFLFKKSLVTYSVFSDLKILYFSISIFERIKKRNEKEKIITKKIKKKRLPSFTLTTHKSRSPLNLRMEAH